jgi:hypothetical protein
VQKEARERARKQSGMASKTEEPVAATTPRANSISAEVEAAKESDRDKDDEREKKGAWNWRWRWGKDKKDSKDGGSGGKDSAKELPTKSAPLPQSCAVMFVATPANLGRLLW